MAKEIWRATTESTTESTDAVMDLRRHTSEVAGNVEQATDRLETLFESITEALFGPEPTPPNSAPHTEPRSIASVLEEVNRIDRVAGRLHYLSDQVGHLLQRISNHPDTPATRHADSLARQGSPR